MKFGMLHIFFIVEPQFKAINFGGVNFWCWVKFMVVFPINFYKSCWSEFVRATKSVLIFMIFMYRERTSLSTSGNWKFEKSEDPKYFWEQ